MGAKHLKMETLLRPGGEIATRPLHFFFLVDTSGSMMGDKIGSLNFAIREALPAMRKAADENPAANLLVRAIEFGDSARWIESTPVPVEDFVWNDLRASGLTPMGAALELLASQLAIPPMSERALPPVIVLVTDGEPTDDFQNGLKAVLRLPWGKKAVRLGIAIGSDANHEVLKAFINNPELPVLQANNAETLANYIRWASTVVVGAVSAPPSQVTGSTGHVHVVPPQNTISSADDVW